MFYRNRGHWRGYRNFWWGWPLFFVFVLGPYAHGFFGLLFGLAVLVMLGLLIRGFVVPLLSRAGFWGNAPSQNDRSYQQPYQPLQQQEYRPYQQGYEPRQLSPEAYQEGGQQNQYPQQSQQYDQYEQPHAQYPQEIPPMEQ